MTFQTMASPDGSRRPSAVLWVYLAPDGQWYFHIEGRRDDTRYPDRAAAMAAARAYGLVRGGYRLYFQMKNGRVSLEMLNSSGRMAMDDGAS